MEDVCHDCASFFTFYQLNTIPVCCIVLKSFFPFQSIQWHSELLPFTTIPSTFVRLLNQRNGIFSHFLNVITILEPIFCDITLLPAKWRLLASLAISNFLISFQKRGKLAWFCKADVIETCCVKIQFSKNV